MRGYNLIHISVLVIFHLLFFAKKSFAQNNSWKILSSVEKANSISDEVFPRILNKNLVVTRITANTPTLFIVDGSGASIPWTWNNKYMAPLTVGCPQEHEMGTYFAMPTQFQERSYLNVYEVKGSLPPKAIETPQKSFTSYPFLSPDNKTLFVVSDRKGSFGKTDIWYFTLGDKGNWEGPYNIGDPINSTGDELSPFLPHPDTLYFSSDGFGGKGKLDIFRSVRENGIWQVPIPMDNINSEDNDADFMTINDSLGILSSDRSGGMGGFDIYFASKEKDDLIQNATITITTNTALITQHIEKTLNAIAFRSCIYIKDFAIDESDKKMLEILADRLLNSPSSTIHLSKHGLTESILNDFLLKGVQKQQIIIDEAAFESMIVVSGGKPILYAPLNASLLICEPQSIDITIDCMPPKSISQWEVKIGDNIVSAGFITPSTIKIPLCDFIPEFKDSIFVIGQGTNASENIVVDSVVIPVQHTLRSGTQNDLPNNTILMWKLDDIQQILPSLARTIKSTHTSSMQCEFVIQGQNASIVHQALQMLSKYPDAQGLTFKAIDLSPDSPYYTLMKRAIAQYPLDIQSRIVPVIVR